MAAVDGSVDILMVEDNPDDETLTLRARAESKLRQGAGDADRPCLRGGADRWAVSIIAWAGHGSRMLHLPSTADRVA